jgi:hypothetical protein
MRILFVLGLALCSVAALGKDYYPEVQFAYNPIIDKDCSIQIQKSWVTEVKNKESFIKNYWDNNSPELLNFVFDQFKIKFSEKIYYANLSVCPPTPSFSNPLILNVSRFLKSYVGENKVNPDYAYLILGFHELMHNWVFDNLHSSALLQKYQNETDNVKDHLHLMALEHFTYTTLGKKDLLGWIERKYPSIGGDYARAWKIVNYEGGEAFLKELYQIY